jgi:hypothetical protein
MLFGRRKSCLKLRWRCNGDFNFDAMKVAICKYTIACDTGPTDSWRAWMRLYQTTMILTRCITWQDLVATKPAVWHEFQGIIFHASRPSWVASYNRVGAALNKPVGWTVIRRSS